MKNLLPKSLKQGISFRLRVALSACLLAMALTPAAAQYRIKGPIVLRWLPDLRVGSVRYPRDVTAGTDFEVTVRVANIARGAAAGTLSSGTRGYMVDLVLSRDNITPSGFATASATFVEDALVPGGRISRTRDLSAVESQEYTARVRVPADTPEGKYNLIARVDSGNVIREVDETNNTAPMAIAVHNPTHR